MDIVSAKVAADKAMEYVNELAPEAKCIALEGIELSSNKDVGESSLAMSWRVIFHKWRS